MRLQFHLCWQSEVTYIFMDPLFSWALNVLSCNLCKTLVCVVYLCLCEINPVITNYMLQSVALFNSCRRLVTVISLTPFHMLVVPKDVFITQFIKDVADPHSEAIIFLRWDLLTNVQFSWTFSCLVTASSCGCQLGWVKKRFCRLDCNCFTGSKLSCLCIIA